MAALQAYKEAGWAVVEAQEGTVTGAGARPEILKLRVFMLSPQQRLIAEQFPHVSDVMAIDGTFSVGNVGINTMALVGHLPEAGGIAVPLAFLFHMGSGSAEDADSLTGTIAWFLRRARESGLGLPELMLHDKCSSTVAAMALVAHEALSSSDALRARAELYRALAEGAAQCTLAQLASARYVLACIAAEAPQPGVGAGAGPGTGAVSSGLPAASTSACAGAGAGAAPLALPVLLLGLLTLILQLLRCKLFSPLLQLQQMVLLECTLLQLGLRSQGVLVVATGVLLLLGGAAPY